MAILRLYFAGNGTTSSDVNFGHTKSAENWSRNDVIALLQLLAMLLLPIANWAMRELYMRCKYAARELCWTEQKR